MSLGLSRPQPCPTAYLCLSICFLLCPLCLLLRMIAILSSWLPLRYGSCLGPLLQLHACVLFSGCSPPVPLLPSTPGHSPAWVPWALRHHHSHQLPLPLVLLGFLFFLSSLPKSLSAPPRLGLTSTPALCSPAASLICR